MIKTKSSSKRGTQLLVKIIRQIHKQYQKIKKYIIIQKLVQLLKSSFIRLCLKKPEFIIL